MFELLAPTHLLFVLLVALVVLGPKRLGETSRSIGRALKSIQEHKDELKEELLGTPEKDEPKEKPSEKESHDKKKVVKEDEKRKEA